MVSWTLILSLWGACFVAMLVERSGVRTTLNAAFKGDLKRETRWLAQYGQGACTLAAAALLFELDKTRELAWVAIMVAAFGASIISVTIKRLLGRVRPGHELAGRFLGFTLRHENFRESFPSSHSASAVAMTVTLAHLYPQAMVTFWVLGIICALLRYVLDAHWPSDVLGGLALGALIGNAVVLGFAL